MMLIGGRCSTGTIESHNDPALSWYRQVLIATSFGAMVASASSEVAAVDLAGRWRVQFGPIDERVDITQVGSTVTIPLVLGCTFTGMADSPFSLQPVGCDAVATFSTQLAGFTSQDENAFLAGIGISGDTSTYEMFATRCECDDGNAFDGDGCDSGCRVEPCFTCSGMPSVCTASGDGASCEDGSVCTTGETCSAESCGGGAPVTPCTDMSGQWDVRLTAFLGSADAVWDVEQRGGTVIVRETGALPEWLGSVNPSTGEAQVSGLPDDVLCLPIGHTVNLTVDSGGDVFAGSGFYGAFPLLCVGVEVDVLGARSGTQVCGDGIVLPPEQCDDGNTSAGDCCGAACELEPGGSSCDDGDACTITSCQAGTCEVDAAVGCPACESCDPLDGCVPAPQTSPACLPPGPATKSSLLLADRSADEGDRVTWRWLRGPDTSPADLGDPLSADDYELCVFDESGPTPTILFRATAPAGGTCGSRPCWVAAGNPPGSTGYRYRDREGSSDGLRRLVVKPGHGGKARIVAKGKGTALVMPGENSHPPLPVAEPVQVRAQLRAGNGTCWEANYSDAGTRRNDSGVFKARGD